MHLHSLNITNLIQASTTDLPQLHRAYDWLHVAPRVSLVADKERVNFLAHDLSHAAILEAHVWLHAAQ